MKLTSTTKDLTNVPKKYCRLVVTEEAPNVHRLVECSDGTLEYRLGAGKWKDMTPRKFRTFLRSIVQAAKAHQIEYLAVQLSRSPFPKLEEYGEQWVLSTIAENFLLAGYEYREYKTEPAKKKPLKEILLCGAVTKAAKAGFERGQIVGAAANTTRDIANASAADMYPEALAKVATKAVKGTGVKVTVLDQKQITAQKMGLLAAVGKGAEHKPRFIIMEYHGGKKSEKPVVLIGKGITYDSGGLNVKPSGAMHDMHLDMSGGAAVIGAMRGIAKLGLKQNVVGIVPAAENAVSADSMRAGDILTSMSGKTVEVMHTDAEGRLVLADALTYAKRYEPKTIIDVATLTGAALVALGQHASAVLTTDETLETTLRAHGEETGDYVWPLPLWEEYSDSVKSVRADLANINDPTSRFGGTITGGMFLSHFVPKTATWAHIDMAPRMTATSSDNLAKGATGEPVRLLVKFVEEY